MCRHDHRRLVVPEQTLRRGSAAQRGSPPQSRVPSLFGADGYTGTRGRPRPLWAAVGPSKRSRLLLLDVCFICGQHKAKPKLIVWDD